MDVYERMWATLVTRLVEADKVTLRKAINYQDVLNYMADLEGYFEEDIRKLKESESQKPLKDE